MDHFFETLSQFRIKEKSMHLAVRSKCFIFSNVSLLLSTVIGDRSFDLIATYPTFFRDEPQVEHLKHSTWRFLSFILTKTPLKSVINKISAA